MRYKLQLQIASDVTIDTIISFLIKDCCLVSDDVIIVLADMSSLLLSLCLCHQPADLIFERFTVNTFNLMKNILHCELYKPAKSIEGLYYSWRNG